VCLQDCGVLGTVPACPAGDFVCAFSGRLGTTSRGTEVPTGLCLESNLVRPGQPCQLYEDIGMPDCSAGYVCLDLGGTTPTCTALCSTADEATDWCPAGGDACATQVFSADQTDFVVCLPEL